MYMHWALCDVENISLQKDRGDQVPRIVFLAL